MNTSIYWKACGFASRTGRSRYCRMHTGGPSRAITLPRSTTPPTTCLWTTIATPSWPCAGGCGARGFVVPVCAVSRKRSATMLCEGRWREVVTGVHGHCIQQPVACMHLRRWGQNCGKGARRDVPGAHDKNPLQVSAPNRGVGRVHRSDCMHKRGGEVGFMRSGWVCARLT